MFNQIKHDIELLQLLPDKYLHDFHDWIRVMFAYHEKYGTDPSVKEAVREWSKQANNYGSDANFDAHWNSVKDKCDDPFTIKSIQHIVNQAQDVESANKRQLKWNMWDMWDKEYPDPEPFMFTPSGVPLMFKGYMHSLVGDRGGRKSLYCIHAALAARKAGIPVVWIDGDSHPSVTIKRLKQHNFPYPYLEEMFIGGKDDLSDIRAFDKLIGDKRPLVILDNASSLGISGDSSNDDVGVGKAFEKYVFGWPEGTTVLMLTQTAKANWGAGSQNKTIVNSYMSEALSDFIITIEPKSPGEYSVIEQTKDRFNAWQGKTQLATVKSHKTYSTLEDYIQQKDETGAVIANRVLEALENNGGCIKGVTNLYGIVRGNNNAIQAAVDMLVENGTVEDHYEGQTRVLSLPEYDDVEQV